jgi:hypothetical protein
MSPILGGDTLGGVRPWDQQDDESPNAFKAFKLYLKQGTTGQGRRSAARVAKSLGYNARTVERWCSGHNWRARAKAWDDHLGEQDQEDIERLRRRAVRSAMGELCKGAGRAAKTLRQIEVGDVDPHPDPVVKTDDGFVFIRGTTNTGALQTPANVRRQAALDRLALLGLSTKPAERGASGGQGGGVVVNVVNAPYPGDEQVDEQDPLGLDPEPE